MSRSYKKEPVYKDNSKYMEKLANRKVRRTKTDIKNGKSHRKLFESYNISDWSTRCTIRDYLSGQHKYRMMYLRGITSKDYSASYTVNNWAKYYKRK